MSFRSKVKGPCAKCNQAIEVGQEIQWNRKAAFKRWHVVCPAVPNTGLTAEKVRQMAAMLKKANVLPSEETKRRMPLYSVGTRLSRETIDGKTLTAVILAAIVPEDGSNIIYQCRYMDGPGQPNFRILEKDVTMLAKKTDSRQTWKPIVGSGAATGEGTAEKSIDEQIAEKGFRVGTRVRILGMAGTIYAMHGGEHHWIKKCITLKRDDGSVGNGVRIEESPYNGNKGWNVNKEDLLNLNVEILGQSEETREGETKMLKKEKEAAVIPTGDAGVFAGLAQAIAPYLEEKLKTKVDEDSIKGLVADALKALAPVTIEIKKENGEVKTLTGVHESFKTLLYLIGKGHHVYLYGPAGSGKSTAASQAAEALSLDFGYISLNPQTPDSRLLGYMDATGQYRGSSFRHCFENGGVFCIDEMDNASGSLLTTLNGMLENGHGAFPDKIVQRHANFIVVATGNTNGRGGNAMFPERRPFDAAFAERFTYIFWEYDTKLEAQLTLAINPKAEPWLNWVKRTRKYCMEHFPKVLLSPRCSFKGATYLKDKELDVKEIAEAVVFKGLDKEIVKKIVDANPLPEKV